MMRDLKHEGNGLLIELNSLGVDSCEEEKEVPLELKAVLQRRAAMFERPSGLPSERARNHAIVSKVGTCPINVRLLRTATRRFKRPRSRGWLGWLGKCWRHTLFRPVLACI